MWFSDADAAAAGRCLAQVADEDRDVADLFLEWRREVELREESSGPGIVERTDQGFAVRLVRDGQTYLSVRDGFDSGALKSALREVARVVPVSAYSVPELGPPDLPERFEDEELRAFPSRVRQAVRSRHVAFDFEMRIARHTRRVQLVGRRLIPGSQREDFYSVTCSFPWGRTGVLTAQLDDDCAQSLAQSLVERFHARDAARANPGSVPLVLGPAAAAVLLHEAVAHALETDTLVLSGRPEAAIGVVLGSALLDVLDSPAELPEGLRRETDDEGLPVLRRWLLRGGRVSQVLADRFHAAGSSHLLPGAARRSTRHLPPVPRSTHLELVPGTARRETLFEGSGGLYFPEISRGRLNPVSGELELAFPCGRRFAAGRLAERVGGCVLRGRLSDVLGSVEAVGAESALAGAGWCAKAGHLLPVWATCSHLRLAGLEVEA